MGREKGIVTQWLCIALGICMLVGAAGTLALWQWNIDSSKKQSAAYVNALRTLISEPQDAVLEERRDNTMSVLSVDGTDFVGIIEMPRYGSVLPVAEDWGKNYKYPCRFNGSIYNRTMQIGATTQSGQYDFYRELSVGDSVVYTDMEGNRYSLEITSLYYSKHADQSALQRKDSSLVLFIKNVYSFEYLIVFCDVPH